MPELTVSEFSYVATSDPQLKSKRSSKFKHKGEYQHFKDYYLSLRNKIKSVFKNNLTFSDLRKFVDKAPDEKKANYKYVAESFIKWATGKNIQHFDPLRARYSYSKSDIICNPELFYRVDGEDRLIKLHFSASQKMSQRRANYICFLLSESCDMPISTCRVLDLKERKEYRFNGNRDHYEGLVSDEILRIESEWDHL